MTEAAYMMRRKSSRSHDKEISSKFEAQKTQLIKTTSSDSRTIKNHELLNSDYGKHNSKKDLNLDVEKPNLNTYCNNCMTSNTPLWRRGEKGVTLCNACGLFLKLHGRPRPISMKTGIVKTRNRKSHNDHHSDSPKKTGRASEEYNKNRGNPIKTKVTVTKDMKSAASTLEQIMFNNNNQNVEIDGKHDCQRVVVHALKKEKSEPVSTSSLSGRNRDSTSLPRLSSILGELPVIDSSTSITPCYLGINQSKRSTSMESFDLVHNISHHNGFTNKHQIQPLISPNIVAQDESCLNSAIQYPEIADNSPNENCFQTKPDLHLSKSTGSNTCSTLSRGVILNKISNDLNNKSIFCNVNPFGEGSKGTSERKGNSAERQNPDKNSTRCAHFTQTMECNDNDIDPHTVDRKSKNICSLAEEEKIKKLNMRVSELELITDLYKKHIVELEGRYERLERKVSDLENHE